MPLRNTAELQKMQKTATRYSDTPVWGQTRSHKTMSKVERITRELPYYFIILHKNLRVPVENIRQQVWSKLRKYFFQQRPWKPMPEDGFFDSQTLIQLRRRLDNLNPAKKESQDTIQAWKFVKHWLLEYSVCKRGRICILSSPYWQILQKGYWIR